MSYRAIVTILPSIISIIKEIEKVIPIEGQGKVKLNAVLEIINILDTKLIQYVPELTLLINSLVKLFNSTGVFQK